MTEVILKFASETPNVHTEKLNRRRNRDAVRGRSTDVAIYVMNFFDQHAGHHDDRHYLCPMNRRKFGGRDLKVEEKHVGEEQQEKAVEYLECRLSRDLSSASSYA